MSCWNLHQRAKLGNEEKIWKLSAGEGLTVGRSNSCDIVLQSQTVESKHAIFEWCSKLMCFIIRDLNTVNGTYINNRPLRGGHAELEHNDAIRFGYDKDHVFRLEESFAPMTTLNTTKTSLSLSPSHAPPQTTTITTSATIQSPGVQLLSQDLVQQHNIPQLGGVQYVALPSSPAGQHGGLVPVITQGGPLTYGYPQSLSPVITVPQAIPLLPQPSSLQILPTTSCDKHSPKLTNSIQKAFPIPPPPPPTDGGDSLNSSYRSDGRRSVHLEQSPSINRGSKLYGKPSWWGDEEDKETSGADREFGFQRPGSQILRVLDPEVRTPSKLSTKDELRMAAISKQRQQQVDSLSSWVVDLGGVGSQPPPRMLRRSRDLDSRPRSADPSPNRLSTIRRDPSPSPRRAVTPMSMKRSSSISTPKPQAVPNSPKGRRQRSATPPVSRPATALPVTRHPVPLSMRPPPHGDKTSSPKRKPGRPNSRSVTPTPKDEDSHCSEKGLHSRTSHHSKPSTSRTSGSVNNPPSPRRPTPNTSHSESNTPSSIPSSATKQKHLPEKVSDRMMLGDDAICIVSSDESSSSLSDHTFSYVSERIPVMVAPDSLSSDQQSNSNSHINESGKEEMEDEKGGSSSKKQWTSDENQSPDSLMLASIEARMRRLGKLAHETARQVTSLKSSIEGGHHMVARETNYLAIRSSSPVMTKAEQSLPEWKFFNKEANSIFRNIRVIEKWLQDIDANLKCIKPEGSDVDFASDGELYLDSIDYIDDSGSEEN